MKKVGETNRLSYSSGTLIGNCEAKYVHYKVKKTKIDIDADNSTEAFNIGKSFHGVLEDTLHETIEAEALTKLVEDKCKKYECEGKEALIEAMCRKYYQLNELTALQAIHCEYEIKTDVFIGYIDVVMKDKMGNWWIVDLKTAARISPLLLSKLKRDTQLNLYGSYFQMVAKDLKLDPSKFAGMRYRVTTKAKLIRKSSETYEGYVQRQMKNIKSYDIAIPRNDKIMDIARKKHQVSWQRSVELFDGEEPKQNMTYCDSFFRPCEYWSQCYGETFTKCAKRLVMMDADAFEAEGDLL